MLASLTNVAIEHVRRCISRKQRSIPLVGHTTLKQNITALQNRPKEIAREIRRAATTQPTVADADLIVENICDRFAQLGDERPSLPAATPRTVLQKLVSKVIVDLKTRDAGVEFVLPDWAADALSGVRLDDHLAYRCGA